MPTRCKARRPRASDGATTTTTTDARSTRRERPAEGKETGRGGTPREREARDLIAANPGITRNLRIEIVQLMKSFTLTASPRSERARETLCG